VRIVFANGRDPVPRGISKWLCRHISQEVCPWNEKFAVGVRSVKYVSREFQQGVQRLADETAKLSGLKRNAAIVLRNIGPEQNAGGRADTALHV